MVVGGQSSVVGKRIRAMPTYPERYKNGEYEQVWAELVALGGQVRHEPLYSDALAVAHETMRRAKYNVEILYGRLKSHDYKCAFPEQAFTPPEPDIAAQIEKFEELASLLPLSVRVWYEVVGAINFMGVHPKLASYDKYQPYYGSDPLVVDPLNDEAFLQYKDWKENCEANKLEVTGPFIFAMAPDYYHKEAASGGAPYGINLPNVAIDATFEDEWHNTTFVNYLRINFRWGGFPGFERGNYRPDELQFLTEGLLPL